MYNTKLRRLQIIGVLLQLQPKCELIFKILALEDF